MDVSGGILRAWMPAIHAGMTEACSIPGGWAGSKPAPTFLRPLRLNFFPSGLNSCFHLFLFWLRQNRTGLSRWLFWMASGLKE
jgi:hypothetical protein